jgi:HK97 family phage portal protein
MSDYTTDSGLVVRTRADDPRSWPDNINGDGVNDPPSSVGPTSSEGYGNTHVMYPDESLPTTMSSSVVAPQVQAWSGWPVEWNTPTWGSVVGLNDILQRVSVVFGALDLNSSILSTMPPYRLIGSTIVESLPWMENPQPEVYTGWTEAMKQVVMAYYGNGEAFVWATSRYPDNSVRTWVMLNPAWVDVEMRGQMRHYEMGGIDITDNVLHLRYSSWPGTPHGKGPMDALAYNLFGASALEKYQSNLAVRGGIPWGALTAPGNLSETQATGLRDRFVQARMSALGAPAVLSGGVTLTPFSISPREMALLELRQFDEARIAILLGVPPLLMGLPSGDSMTYKNAEGIYDFHWRAYLRPKAATIMEAISGWALRPGERVELNRDEYTRPALGERVTAYEGLFGIFDPATGERAMSIDEIRAAERMTGKTPQSPLAPASVVAPPQPAVVA